MWVLSAHILDVVNEDLGVILANNLKSARQCQLAYSKAKKVLRLIAQTRHRCASQVVQNSGSSSLRILRIRLAASYAKE